MKLKRGNRKEITLRNEECGVKMKKWKIANEKRVRKKGKNYDKKVKEKIKWEYKGSGTTNKERNYNDKQTVKKSESNEWK